MQLSKYKDNISGPIIGNFESKPCASTADRIDLIISDFNMPGMNGQEVVDHLRVIDHSVKVLLSSGGLSVPHEEDAIVRGFDGFLQKPYSIEILSDKIDEILN